MRDKSLEKIVITIDFSNINPSTKRMELNDKLNSNIDFYKIHLREFQTRKKKKKEKISTRPTFSRTPLANYQGMGR